MGAVDARIPLKTIDETFGENLYFIFFLEPGSTCLRFRRCPRTGVASANLLKSTTQERRETSASWRDRINTWAE